jgi:hypothetical protein
MANYRESCLKVKEFNAVHGDCQFKIFSGSVKPESLHWQNIVILDLITKEAYLITHMIGAFNMKPISVPH